MRWIQDGATSPEAEAIKPAHIAELIHAYRSRGHLMADVDPLSSRPRKHPDLDIQTHGLTLWDLDRVYATAGFAGRERQRMREVLARLRDAVWNHGYGDVRIDTSVPRPDASHLVPIRIDIDPRYLTRVGTVAFDGNRALSDGTLRRVANHFRTEKTLGFLFEQARKTSEEKLARVTNGLRIPGM